MHDAARFDCSNCNDRGWIKDGTYAERPYSSTRFLVTRWLPCEHCHAALTNPRPESMNVVGTGVIPSGVKPVPIPPRSSCGTAHKIVSVLIGDGEVEVEIPCFHCQALIFWPLCATKPHGPKFDFARDLIEANRPPRRPNPRI